MNARSYAHVYLKRGKLKKEPCQECGDLISEMHHPDYSKPLKIIWLCRVCHLELHRSLTESDFIARSGPGNSAPVGLAH